jgi:hypothetical protein
MNKSPEMPPAAPASAANALDGEEVLSQASQHLAAGGAKARREVVRIILGLERLLRTAP